jgi:hypothetical protein
MVTLWQRNKKPQGWNAPAVGLHVGSDLVSAPGDHKGHPYKCIAGSALKLDLTETDMIFIFGVPPFLFEILSQF